MKRRNDYCVVCKKMIAYVGVVCGSCKKEGKESLLDEEHGTLRREWTANDNDIYHYQNKEWYEEMIKRTKEKLSTAHME